VTIVPAEKTHRPGDGGARSEHARPVRRLLDRLGRGSATSATLLVIGTDGRAVIPGDPALSLDDGGDTLGGPGAFAQDEKSRAPTDIFDLVEHERLRIARDIHDGPAQILSNLVLKTEIIERLVAAGSPLVGDELEEFRAMARVALDETRRLIFDLRPMSLDDLGLAPALRRLTRQLGDRCAAQTAFHLVGEDRRIPERVEAMLFRVAQEALTNSVRHARATRIETTLTIGPNHATVTVRDDGDGFDVREAVVRAARDKRLGLLSMRERAALHDAVVDVVSKAGAGTKVRISARF
jgi:signal transduction histidine kinase